MKILFKNAFVIDTINKEIVKSDVLVKGKYIEKVQKNIKDKVDKVFNLEGKWISPGFIDGHIHIESSKLFPTEFAKAVVPCGTTAIVADPHEIANVAGTKGIDFFLKTTKGLPIDVYFTAPSCVPATCFDVSYGVLTAKKLAKYVNNPRVVGLAEVMDYVGVINNNKDVLDKIKLFKDASKAIDGHAPGLTGKDLVNYVKHGIQSDHECTTLKEALEKIKLGQRIMIKNGSASQSLKELMPLIGKYSDRCMLVVDDLEPLDIVKRGHINCCIREIIKNKYDIIESFCLATIYPARYFKIKDLGAIKPGYRANFNILDDLKDVTISKVYHNGTCVYSKTNGVTKNIKKVSKESFPWIFKSINVRPITLDDLKIKAKGKHKAAIIEVIPRSLITGKVMKVLDFDKNNGIDVKNDILKIVTIERHKATKHKAIGFIKGFQFKNGAIASTVSHDSHNIIAIGSSDRDILVAINKIKNIGGGNVVVRNGKVLASLPLPIAGLMSNKPINTVIANSKKIDKALKTLKVNPELSPFMNMAFISLPVIPSLKITVKGLVDVDSFKLIDVIQK